MYILNKETNGHCMQITIYTEMGGAEEEIGFWCHTCDPEGRREKTFDLRQMTPVEAMGKAIAMADDHSSVDYSGWESEGGRC